jgi:hypothetical protein
MTKKRLSRSEKKSVMSGTALCLALTKEFASRWNAFCNKFRWWGVGGSFRFKYYFLYGNSFIKPFVNRFIDRAHSALSELIDDTIPAL